LRPYVVLIRPANVLTSICDVLAGLAIASGFGFIGWDALLLILATACLYAGGIVFNDYFDRHIDIKERPERPIPSGKISPRSAVIFGIFLFIIAVAAAFIVGILSGVLALSIIFFALLYDRWMKHSVVGGPLFMGMARAANLLLGISYAAEALHQYYWLGIIPLLFIASITLTSREENRGDNRTSLLFAMAMDIAVIALLVYASFLINAHPWVALGLILIWAFLVLSSKWKAYRENSPENIKLAVRTGVMSIILMDAAYAGMVPEITYVVLILSLFPLSLLLARKFAVT